MTLIQFPNPREVREKGTAVSQALKPYLSPEEVANLFGFSARTITMWAAAWQESGGRRGIPAFKMGRNWRFERKELQAYIDGKKLPLQPITETAASA